MPGRRQVEAFCRNHNKERNVDTASRFSIREYWDTGRGNFLVTGGAEGLRCDMLCEKLCLEMRFGSIPTYVLTTSYLTEESLIDRMKRGAEGRLVVTSRNYPNYRFFHGWSAAAIEDFLIRATNCLGMNSPGLPVYIHAFAHVLSLCYNLEMASLLALAEYDDESIARIGERAGADEVEIARIRRYTDEGDCFRRLLGQLKEAFSPLMADNPENGYSLETVRPGCGEVYLLNIRSRSQRLLNLYFAEEFRYLSDRREKSRIVLDECPIYDDDGIVELINTQYESGTEIGVVAQNVARLTREGNIDFPLRVILLDRGVPDENVNGMLDLLGTYTHYEPVLGTAAPPGPLNLFAGKNWTVQQEPGRLRVRPQDTTGYRAVLYWGSNRRILLARELF